MEPQGDSAINKFGAVFEHLLIGLFKDCLTNVIYDYVKLVWDAYQETTNERIMLKFVEMVRTRQDVRTAIKSKSTNAIDRILMEEVGEPIGGAIREICMALSNPKLVKVDAEAKMWKRIQKLVYAARLEEIIGGKKKDFVKERIVSFNKSYRIFLQRLLDVFGGDQRLLSEFDDMVANEPGSALDAFKQKAMPLVPHIVKMLQDENEREYVLETYFGDDSRWLTSLPLVDSLPIEEGWDERVCPSHANAFRIFRQVAEFNPDAFFSAVAGEEIDRTNVPEKWFVAVSEIDHHVDRAEFELKFANQTAILKQFGDVALKMTGLDALINSPIVEVLKRRAMEYTKDQNLQAAHILPNSSDFDSGVAFGLVKALIDALPEATGYVVSKDDVDALIQNAMTGGGDIPESFHEVFSPDMVDLDCLDLVADLPGVGDVLGPIYSSMQGQMKGLTGEKPAFGSVATPAWMEQ